MTIYEDYLKEKQKQQQNNKPATPPKRQLADPMTIARRAYKGAKKNVSNTLKAAAPIANKIVKQAVNSMPTTMIAKPIAKEVGRVAKNLSTSPEEYKKQQGIKPGESYIRGRSKNPYENLTAPGYTPMQRIKNLGDDLKSAATDFGAGYQKSIASTIDLPSNAYHAQAALRAKDDTKKAEHLKAIKDHEDFYNRHYKTNGNIMSGLGYLGGEASVLAATGGMSAIASVGKATEEAMKLGVKQALKAAAKGTISSTAKAKGKQYTAKQLSNLAGVKATAQMGNLAKFAKMHPFIGGIPRQAAENAVFGLGTYGLKKATNEEANLGKEMLFAQGAGLGMHAGIHGIGAVGKPIMNSEPVQNAIQSARDNIAANPTLSNWVASVNNFLNLNSGIKTVDQLQKIKASLASNPNLSYQQIDMINRLNNLSPADLAVFQKLVRDGVNPADVTTEDMLLAQRFSNAVYQPELNPQQGPIIQRNIPEATLPQEPVVNNMRTPEQLHQEILDEIARMNSEAAARQAAEAERIQQGVEARRKQYEDLINSRVKKQQQVQQPQYSPNPADDINLFEQARDYGVPQTNVGYAQTPVAPKQPTLELPKVKPNINDFRNTGSIYSAKGRPVKNQKGINTPKEVETLQNEPSYQPQNGLPNRVVEQNNVTPESKVIKLEPGTAEGANTKYSKIEKSLSENKEVEHQNIYEGTNAKEEFPEVDSSLLNGRFFLKTPEGTKVVHPIKDGKWDNKYTAPKRIGNSKNHYYVEEVKNTPKTDNSSAINSIKNEIKNLNAQKQELIKRGEIKKATKVSQKAKRLEEQLKDFEERESLKADEGYANESDMVDAYREEFEDLEDIGTVYSEGYNRYYDNGYDKPKYVTEDEDFIRFWNRYKNTNKHNVKTYLLKSKVKSMSPEKRNTFLENIKRQEELEARRSQPKQIGEEKTEETKSFENLDTTEDVVNAAKDEGITFEEAPKEKGEVSATSKKISEKTWSKINEATAERMSYYDYKAEKNKLFEGSDNELGLKALKDKRLKLEASIKQAELNNDYDALKLLRTELNNVKSQSKVLSNNMRTLETSYNASKYQKIKGFDAVKNKFENNKNNKAKLQEIYDDYTNRILDSDAMSYSDTAEYMFKQINDLASEYGLNVKDVSNLKTIQDLKVAKLGREFADIKKGKTPLKEGQTIESAEYDFIKEHSNELNSYNKDIIIDTTESGQPIKLGDVLSDHYVRTSDKALKDIRELTSNDWEAVIDKLQEMFPKDNYIKKIAEGKDGVVNVEELSNIAKEKAREIYKKYYKIIKNRYTDFDAPINREGHNFDFQDTRSNKIDQEFYDIDNEMKKLLGQDWHGNPWKEEARNLGKEDVSNRLSAKGDPNKQIKSTVAQDELKKFEAAAENIDKIKSDLRKGEIDVANTSKEDVIDFLQKKGHGKANRKTASEWYDKYQAAEREKLSNAKTDRANYERAVENEKLSFEEDSNTISHNIDDYYEEIGGKRTVKLEKVDSTLDKLNDKEWVDNQIAKETKYNIDKNAIKESFEGKVPKEELNEKIAEEYTRQETEFINERRKYYSDLKDTLKNKFSKALSKYYERPEIVNKVLTTGKGADKLHGKEFTIAQLADVNETCKALTKEGLGATKLKFESLEDPNFIAGLDTNTGDIVFNSNATGTAFDHEIQHLKDFQTPEGKALLQRQAKVSNEYNDLNMKNHGLWNKANILMVKNGITKDTKQIWSKLKKAGLSDNEIKVLKKLRDLKKERKILEQINEGRAELAERGENVRSIQEYIKEKARTKEGKEIEKYYSDFVQMGQRRGRTVRPVSTNSRRGMGDTRGLVAKKKSVKEFVQDVLGHKELPWKQKGKPINKEVRDVYEFFKNFSEEGTAKAVKYDIDLTAAQAVNRQQLKSGKEGLAVYFPRRGEGSSNGIDITRDYAEEYLHKVGLYGAATKDTPQAVTARDGMNLITMNNKRDFAIGIVERVKNFELTKSYNGKNLEPGYVPENSSLMATAIFGRKSKAFVDTLMKGEEAIRRAFPKEEAEHWIAYMKRHPEPDMQIPKVLHDQLYNGYGEDAKQYALRYCQPGQIHGDLGSWHKALKYTRAINKVYLDFFKRNVLTSNSFVINNRIGNTALLMMSSENPKELMDAYALAKKLKDSDLPPELIGGNIAEALGNTRSNKRLTITGDTEIDNWLNALYGNEVDLSKIAKTIKEKGVTTSSKNSLGQEVKHYGTKEVPNPDYKKQMRKARIINGIAKYEKQINKIRDAYANFNEKGKFTLKNDVESGVLGEIFERKVAYARELNKVRAKLIEDTGNKFITQLELLKHVKEHPEIEESIVKSVCDALGDYNSFSRFEQEVLKQIIPFYSWTRTISRHIVKNGIKYPERYALFALEYNRFMENEELRRKSYQRGIIPLGKKDPRSGEQLGINLLDSTANPFKLELPSINNTHPLFQQAKFLATGKHDIGGVSSRKYLEKTDWGDKTKYYIDKKGNRYNNLPVTARVNSILMDLARNILFTNNRAVNFEQLIQTAVTGQVPDKQFEDSLFGYRHGDKFNDNEKRFSYNHTSRGLKYLNWATGNKVQPIKDLNKEEKKRAEIWRERHKKK